MKLSELCKLCDVEYNKSHPKRSLNKIKQKYVIEEIKPYDYNLIRELTKEEQITGKKLTQCKKLLCDSIIVQLSFSENNTIRTDMKGYLELFNVVNNKYRYFAYNNMSEEKCRLLENFIDPISENIMLCNYVDDVNPILYRLVKEVFKKLKAEYLIHVKEHLMFSTRFKIPNEDGSITEYIKTHEATNDQVEEYMKLFRETAKELNITNIDNINNRTKKKIKNMVCRQLGITYAYTEYELVLNRDGLKNEIENRQDLKELKDSLNKNIIHKLNMSTQGELKNYSTEDKTECSEFLIRV